MSKKHRAIKPQQVATGVELAAKATKPHDAPLFQGATVQDRALIMIGAGLNKGLINSYLTSATNGDPRYLSAFKREMLNDAFLSGEVNKIRSKLISSPMTFSTFPSNLAKPSVANTAEAKRAHEITDYVKRQLLDNSDLLRKAISDLWYGLLDEVAVIEIIASVRDGEVALDDLVTVPQERICYVPNTMTLGVQLGSDPSKITPLDQLDGRYIVLVADQTDPSPARRGLLRKCISSWFTLRYLGEWWARSTEVNGQPTRVAWYNPSDKDMKAELDALMRAAGSSTYMVLPEGTKVDFINSITAANTDLYEKLKDSCHSDISIALIGATQTTEIKPNSGSRASSEVHLAVSSNTINGYALSICAILRDQLVSRLVEWQFSADDARKYTPTMAIRVMGYDDLTVLSEAVEKFVNNGLDVAQSYVHDASGIPSPDKQAPLMTPSAKPSPFGGQPGDAPAPAPGKTPTRAMPFQPKPADQVMSAEQFAALEPDSVEKKIGDVLIKPYADHAKKIADEGGSLHRILASLSLFALSNGKSKQQAKEIVAAYCVDQFKRGWNDAQA